MTIKYAQEWMTVDGEDIVKVVGRDMMSTGKLRVTVEYEDGMKETFLEDDFRKQFTC